MSKNKMIKGALFCVTFLLAGFLSLSRAQASDDSTPPHIQRIIEMENELGSTPANSLENRAKINTLSAQIRTIKIENHIPLEQTFSTQPTHSALVQYTPQTSKALTSAQSTQLTDSESDSEGGFCDTLNYIFCCLCCCGDTTERDFKEKNESSHLISSYPRTETPVSISSHPKTPNGKKSTERQHETLSLNFSHFPGSSHLMASRQVVRGEDGHLYTYDTTIRVEPLRYAQTGYNSALNINDDSQ